MGVHREDVDSREFKRMLAASRFPSDEAGLREAASAFWDALAQRLLALGLSTRGSLERVPRKRVREVRFLDTESLALRRWGYVLRVRQDLEGQRPPQWTLKFRHADRYLAQDRDLRGTPGDARVKFEEDLKPARADASQLRTLYSFSARCRREGPDPEELAEVAQWFPVLAPLVEGSGSGKLHTVRGFAAVERVVKGASLVLPGPGDELEAECALVLWNEHEREAAHPLLAEFSFRYAAESEAFPGSASRAALDAFDALRMLPEWTNPESPTKTGFVFGDA